MNASTRKFQTARQMAVVKIRLEALCVVVTLDFRVMVESVLTSMNVWREVVLVTPMLFVRTHMDTINVLVKPDLRVMDRYVWMWMNAMASTNATWMQLVQMRSDATGVNATLVSKATEQSVQMWMNVSHHQFATMFPTQLATMCSEVTNVCAIQASYWLTVNALVSWPWKLFSVYTALQTNFDFTLHLCCVTSSQQKRNTVDLGKNRQLGKSWCVHFDLSSKLVCTVRCALIGVGNCRSVLVSVLWVSLRSLLSVAYIYRWGCGDI